MAKEKKKHFKLEEHVMAANNIILAQYSIAYVARTYHRNPRVRRAALRCDKTLKDLCTELQQCVVHEFPNMPNEDKLKYSYYPLKR